MLVSHDEDILLNIFIYYVNNIPKEHILGYQDREFQDAIKHFFSFIFLIDIAHFKQTGRSITELDYHFDPKDWSIIPSHSDKNFFNQFVKIISLKEKFEFDNGNFSNRQLGILEDVIFKFDMFHDIIPKIHEIQTSLMKNTKDIVEIPLELFVDGEYAEDILEMAKEYKAMKKHFGRTFKTHQ